MNSSQEDRTSISAKESKVQGSGSGCLIALTGIVMLVASGFAFGITNLGIGAVATGWPIRGDWRVDIVRDVLCSCIIAVTTVPTYATLGYGEATRRTLVQRIIWVTLLTMLALVPASAILNARSGGVEGWLWLLVFGFVVGLVLVRKPKGNRSGFLTWITSAVVASVAMLLARGGWFMLLLMFVPFQT